MWKAFSAKVKCIALSRQGYTLVEVLLAISILSIIFLSFFLFFTNAYQYTKENQSKTVGIHAARNAIIYLENQPFDDVKKLTGQTITIDNCSNQDVATLFADKQACENILNPKINNVHYQVDVAISDYAKEDLDAGSPSPIQDLDEDKLQEFVLHTSASIKWKEAKNNRERSSIEGIVVDESLR